MKRVNLLRVLSFLTCSAHYCLNHLRTIQFTSLLFRSNNNVALPIGGLLLKHARRGTWVVGGQKASFLPCYSHGPSFSGHLCLSAIHLLKLSHSHSHLEHQTMFESERKEAEEVEEKAVAARP